MFLRVLFMSSNGKIIWEFWRQIGVASAVMCIFKWTVVVKTTESEGKALNLPDNLRSNSHLWS